MRNSLTIALLVIFLLPVHAQKKAVTSIKIAYYNCDSFYNTTDDKYPADDNYTATGKMFWGEKRYGEKLAAAASLLESAFGAELPDILILGEVEDRATAEAIIARGKLKRQNYRVEFIDNPSGLGTALLTTHSAVKKVSLTGLTPETYKTDGETMIARADITLPDDKIYYLYINRWPGRSLQAGGGEQARIMCAVAVRKDIDSILNFEPGARIIIAGTYSDEPTNRSIMSVLNATDKKHNIHYRDLLNPFYTLHNNDNRGTVVVNGTWQMFDYFLFSPSVAAGEEGFSLGEISVNNGNFSEPVPTFRGNEFAGGAGGHLPVSIILKTGGDE